MGSISGACAWRGRVSISVAGAPTMGGIYGACAWRGTGLDLGDPRRRLLGIPKWHFECLDCKISLKVAWRWVWPQRLEWTTIWYHFLGQAAQSVKNNNLGPILSNFCAKLLKLSKSNPWAQYMYRDWHPSEQHQRLV